jgi:hypothetical protein
MSGHRSCQLGGEGAAGAGVVGATGGTGTVPGAVVAPLPLVSRAVDGSRDEDS